MHCRWKRWILLNLISVQKYYSKFLLIIFNKNDYLLAFYHFLSLFFSKIICFLYINSYILNYIWYYFIFYFILSIFVRKFNWCIIQKKKLFLFIFLRQIFFTKSLYYCLFSAYICRPISRKFSLFSETIFLLIHHKSDIWKF